MRPRTFSAIAALCVLAVFPAAAETMLPPYAGQQSRAIKALSDEDIATLRKGEGIGMAKAAELNGYPGPAHVIALADQLDLTENQRHQVTAIFERMSAGAKPLGAEVITREQTLDQLFAIGKITSARLTAETASIAELQGRLRAVHLAAHLETYSLLNPEQLVLYQQLRGYGDPATLQHSHHHG